MQITDALRKALRAAPKLCSTDVRIVMLELYETEYGIYNHRDDSQQRPMANIAMHAAENTSEGSLLYERMRLFAENKVGIHFNVSFMEFLEQPTDICKKQMEIAAQLTTTLNKDTTDVLAGLHARTEHNKGKAP